MEEVRKQLKKLQFSLLTQKKYFYYYIAKHIPIYFSPTNDKKLTVTPKGIIFHTLNIELDEFIIATHGLISKWPERRKEFVKKHGFMSDVAFDLVASLKAAVEADTEVKIDLARLGLDREKLRRNSVESLAKELLPNIEGIPISLGISFGKDKSQKSQENNQNAGSNAEGSSESQSSEGEGDGGDENKNENGKGCLGIPISVGGCCGEGEDNGQQGEPNDGEGNAEGEYDGEGEDGDDTPVEIQKGNADENGNVDLPQIVADAINYENMLSAGRGLGADRILDELTRPKINIWRLINATIAQGIRKSRRTWRRLNRKLPMIRPGREYYGCDAMVILDSSGSIGEKTYKKFAGIIEQLMRRGGRFHVVSFSDGYIDHGINPQMKKIKTKSGGTYPQCLTELISREKPQMVVMLTDGDWFGDYKSFLNVIKRVPDSILITTYYTHAGFKKIFKIEED